MPCYCHCLHTQHSLASGRQHLLLDWVMQFTSFGPNWHSSEDLWSGGRSTGRTSVGLGEGTWMMKEQSCFSCISSALHLLRAGPSRHPLEPASKLFGPTVGTEHSCSSLAVCFWLPSFTLVIRRHKFLTCAVNCYLIPCQQIDLCKQGELL